MERFRITCDQAFFFSGERESVAARESVVGRRKEKRTSDRRLDLELRLRQTAEMTT